MVCSSAEIIPILPYVIIFYIIIVFHRLFDCMIPKLNNYNSNNSQQWIMCKLGTVLSMGGFRLTASGFQFFYQDMKLTLRIPRNHKVMAHIMFDNILLLQTMRMLRKAQPRILCVCFVTNYSTSRASAFILGRPSWDNTKQEYTHLLL